MSENKTKYRQKARYDDKGNPLNSRARDDLAFRRNVGKKVIADYREQRRIHFAGLDFINPKLLTCIPLAFLKTKHPKFIYLPFSTIGLSCVVRELFHVHENAFKTSGCTIQDLYVWSLYKLQQQRCVVNESLDAPFKPQEFSGPSVENTFDPNLLLFKPLAKLINSYACYDSNNGEYISVIPPGTDENPFYVNLENISELIEKLSSENTSLNVQQFEDLKAIPGAVFECGKLVNANSFSLDLQHCYSAVQRLVSVMMENNNIKQMLSPLTFSARTVTISTFVFPVGGGSDALVPTHWMAGVTFGHKINCSGFPCDCATNLSRAEIDVRLISVDGVEILEEFGVKLLVFPLFRLRWQYRMPDT